VRTAGGEFSGSLKKLLWLLLERTHIKEDRILIQAVLLDKLERPLVPGRGLLRSKLSIRGIAVYEHRPSFGLWIFLETGQLAASWRVCAALRCCRGCRWPVDGIPMVSITGYSSATTRPSKRAGRP
jgi:hypothetical protein